MRYDYIIAGGGCAGLSLAYYLSESPLRDKRVLIIDADDKRSNDRTWCFWSKAPTAFDDIVAKEWQTLGYCDEQGQREEDLGALRYKMIRGIDFYEKVRQRLARFDNIRFLKGRITKMGESEEGAYVEAGGQRYQASWVFNSCFRREASPEDEEKYHFLLQHFLGWRVRCGQPQFDPKKGTLMDFRASQHRDTRFFYLLPLSEEEALVEYTVFSKQRLHKKNYERALEEYLEKNLGIKEYTILEKEMGAIPMTDRPFPKQQSCHIINIGTSGGAVKPTTGYAFLNIQRQTRAMVQRLIQHDSPLLEPLRSSRFVFYDRLLLNILQYYGEEGKPIFSRLFHRNRIPTILTFMAEETTLWQEARLFASLPILTFLKAVGRVYLWGKLRNWKGLHPDAGIGLLARAVKGRRRPEQI